MKSESPTLASLQLMVVLAFTLTSVFASPVRQPRSDDASPLEAVVSQLSQQVTQQQAQIAALQTQQDKSSQRVAFHARLSDNNNVHVNEDQLIQFDHVLTNQGSAYDPATGIFTAPASGLYVFLFTSRGNGDVDAGVHLGGDGLLSRDYPFLDTRGTMATQHGVFHLDQGQRTWVAGLRNNVYLYSWDSTFTGFLLHPDP